ncbi:MAG: cytochrome P460 family protein [Acidobacteriaceae bacterium]
MRIVGRLIVVALALFAVLQIFRPGIPARPATAEIQVPREVKQVLVKNCYSCHSDQRRLSWFDQIVPGYWLVRHDILTARDHLNFSTLGAKPAAAQKATLYEAVNMVQLGAMPLPQFLRLHPEARVTPQEMNTLKTYLAPWTPALQPSATQADQAQSTTRVPLTKVPPELNGMAFDPTFESWKPLSMTDRGDNGTFRFILGNIAAIKASQTGDISPWPDGARFAKIAWQQVAGPDGLVHPGKFIQVELMVKNAGDYKDTEGWGWGRWRGLDMKPYGQNAHFVNECTGCHQPLGGNDHVYTMPMTAAKVTGVEVVNNASAAVSDATDLPHQPLVWGAITMYVDPKNHTMATLYGNDEAMDAVEAHRAAPAYPGGAVLALVTWTQREDPHWFGARIPDRPLSVEFVEAGSQPHYRRFSGTALEEDERATKIGGERASFMLGLPPAPLP